MIKQFKTGYEAKTYLYSLKKFYEDRNLKNMESFECKGIEYGYVLEEALNLIGDFKNIDFDELRNYKIIFPEEYQKYLEENEQKLNGSTIKFKLSEEASEKIDEITNYLAEYWKVRLYRAFTVKIVLKYLYLKLIEKKEF
ncbi:hypothetical protein [Holdemanella biformis]|uniref:hypothetical protein n=1 Tax=Holdemanella biformis TaxID=1735 RepID=UPI0018981EC2|nr:hypothetical protein [Holdemanella biformis]